MTHATRRGNANFGVLLVLIGVAIAILNAVVFHPGAGTQWTKRTEHVHTLEDGSEVRWTEHEAVSVKEGREMAALEEDAAPLFARTAGLWGAAILTLCIFSFLLGDNPLYKAAEAIVVGASAAYWMVIGFWETIVPNLLAGLFPEWTRNNFMPKLPDDASVDVLVLPLLFGAKLPFPLLLVPLALSVLLLLRLAPKIGWISRWPTAFIIGVFCGLRFISSLEADFLSQIGPTIKPLIVMGKNGFDLESSFSNIVLVLGTLACLVYFFFSVEHKGVVGKVARSGIWLLMITFGAAFGYTVMGRIALLAGRFEFLFDDWLWLIDPKDAHPAQAFLQTIAPMLT